MRYGFDRQSVARIGRVVQAAEAVRPPAESTRGPNWQFIRVTGEVTVDGNDYYAGDGLAYWPGRVEVWLADASEWQELGECWIREVNDLGLETDFVYGAMQVGDVEVNGELRPLFLCALRGGVPGGFGSGSGASGYLGDGCGEPVDEHQTVTPFCVDGRTFYLETTVQTGSPMRVCTRVVEPPADPCEDPLLLALCASGLAVDQCVEAFPPDGDSEAACT